MARKPAILMLGVGLPPPQGALIYAPRVKYCLPKVHGTSFTRIPRATQALPVSSYALAMMATPGPRFAVRNSSPLAPNPYDTGDTVLSPGSF